MKVVLLVPCLMLDNNRKANHEALRLAKDSYGFDEIVINAQEFEDSDYEVGFTYIKNAKRQGFVRGRNQLLEWFYNSDADYAVWIDANARVTKASMNDFRTLVEATKEGKVDVDAVFATLGIWISGERMTAKQMPDYFDKVYLVNFKQGYDWLHGTMIKNFKKYYGQEVYIDERCDPAVGTSEDVYFARIIKRLFDYRLCPTITISKPSNKTSTWVADKDGYKYAKVDFKTVDAYIEENIKKFKLVGAPATSKTIVLDRVDLFKADLKEYKTRKKVKGGLLK